MIRNLHRLFLLGLIFEVTFSASNALARKRGIASSGCDGCHGSPANSSLTFSPPEVAPGSTALLRFTIADPDAKVGGIFIEVDDLDRVSVSEDSNLAVVSSGVTHTLPRNFEDGRVTFELAYRVPEAPGSTRFSIWTLAGNGDGRNDGDEGNAHEFDLLFGCEGQTYYRDLDGDGYGRLTMPRIHCAGAPPESYAAEGNDCDDNSAERHPNAVEFCNRKDDDCDGDIDEGAVPVTLYPDADGDGYYSYEEGLSEETVVGCTPYEGYADLPGDCDSSRAMVNPGMEEVCDLLLDEDCDGRVDERARPICGEGWCRRESRTCSLDDCTPGEPVDESCNFLDDDCDGDVDEGELCSPGQECLAGECRTAPQVPSQGLGPETPEESPRSASNTGCQSDPTTPRPFLPVVAATSLLCVAAFRRRRAVTEMANPSRGG